MQTTFVSPSVTRNGVSVTQADVRAEGNISCDSRRVTLTVSPDYYATNNQKHRNFDF